MPAWKAWVSGTLTIQSATIHLSCGLVSVPTDLIFYYEALCVLSALTHASTMFSTPIRIIIFTDNTNTVDMFNSMRGLPAYNYILRSSVDIRLATGHQLRVLHVPGHENDVADAISRRQLVRAMSLHPGLRLRFFEPPRLPLGVARK